MMNDEEQYLDLIRTNELCRLQISRLSKQLAELKDEVIRREAVIAEVRKKLVDGD